VSEEIEKILELTESRAIEMLGTEAATPPRRSRWATTSLWAGGIGLLLALLAFPLAERSDDMGTNIWILGILACTVTLMSSVVGLIRIARSQGKQRGSVRAWLGLGLGLLAGAALFVWFVGMVARTFHW